MNNSEKKDIYGEIRDKIKAKKEEYGLSYSELEELTGISKSTLQRYVTGATPKIPVDFLFKLEEIFHMEKGSLSGWEQRERINVIDNSAVRRVGYSPYRESYLNYNEESPKKKAVSFREISEKPRTEKRGYTKIGLPIDYEKEKKDLIVTSGYENEPTYYIVMNDDSMKEARILKGDIIYISEYEVPKEGDIVAVSVNGAVTVRFFHKYANGTILTADCNSSPIYINSFEEEKHRILGKAIYFQSKL